MHYNDEKRKSLKKREKSSSNPLPAVCVAREGLQHERGPETLRHQVFVSSTVHKLCVCFNQGTENKARVFLTSPQAN